MKKILRIGSRGSPLALLQAEETRKKLLSVHPALADTTDIEIIPIVTSGDWRPEQREKSFRELGGNKELFTKEIDEALLAGAIDIAVHSMKDVAAFLPKEIEFMAILERADPRDAFIGRAAKDLDELPKGARVGTSSLRRQAQLLAHRPDLKIVPLRGNVETRLKKLADGQADATILALAGLQRLNLADRASSILPVDIMLPSAAQGAIGVAAHAGNEAMRELLQPVNAQKSFTCVAAERAFLQILDGSCETPIGALATCDAAGKIHLEGLVAKPDGTSLVKKNIEGAAADAGKIGKELGARVKQSLPPDFFS